MNSCSRFSGFPGAMGCVGYWRCRICMPVFSSVQMTTRPCSKKRRALRYKEQMARFGLKVWVVAVEPIDTAMGFEVRLIQQTPDTGTTHRPEPSLMEGGDQVVKAPTRGGAVVRRGFMGGHRHHLQPLCGGKSAAADPGAAHL